MTEERVSSRYSLALIQSAQEINQVDIVYQDLALIHEYIGLSKDLRTLLKSPVVTHNNKQKVFEQIFEGKISVLTLKFLHLLAEKRREGLIEDIIKQYEKEYNTLNKLVKVKISSATELDEKMKEKIEAKLTQTTQRKVLSKYLIDKSLKGGVKIQIGDWIYDASLSSQLDSLYKSLSEGTK